jgi:ribonuclease HI
LWRELGLEDVRLQLCTLPDAKQCIEAVLRLKPEKSALVAILLNNLWWERNKVREGDSGREQLELAGITWRQFWEFRQLVESKQLVQPGHVQAKWSRPQVGMLKINVDGGFIKDYAKGSWGYVIRNDEGEVIQAGAGKIAHALQPCQTELMACIQGIKAAMHLGVHRVVLETDALIVTQALQTTDFRLSMMGGLVYELKDLLATEFFEARVSYTPRFCNKVAHELARFGSSCQGDIAFLPGNLPDCTCAGGQ